MATTGAVERASWLCRTEAERARVVDMERRLRPVRAITFALFAAVLLASSPWLGWWTVVPLGVSVLVFAIGSRDLDNARRPEYRIAIAWGLTQVAIATAVVLTGGPESPAVPWLVVPAVTIPARFGGRGVIAGIGFTALLIIAVTVGAGPQVVIDNPPLLFFPLALLAGVTILTLALSSSDIQHRGEAVIDALTGMLNRKAFERRMEELVQQSRVNGQQVALVMADIDCFKRVNDEHGHARGDEVLEDAAYRLRKQLRAFDLAYRLGGEEFGVLLPGASTSEAAAVAERLREAVEEAPVAGLPVTMSFGVASSQGAGLAPDVLYEEADEALYAAKEGGRNRVATAGAATETAATGATWLARPSQPGNRTPAAARRRGGGAKPRARR